MDNSGPKKKSQNKTKAPHPPNLLQHMKFFNLQVEWEGGRALSHFSSVWLNGPSDKIAGCRLDQCCCQMENADKSSSLIDTSGNPIGPSGNLDGPTGDLTYPFGNTLWLIMSCDWGQIISFWGDIINKWGQIISFGGHIISFWGQYPY